ncbi:hypothetical protein Bca4012_067916 [Brassica carinata]
MEDTNQSAVTSMKTMVCVLDMVSWTVGQSMGSAWFSSCDESGYELMDGFSLGYELMDGLNGTWLVASSRNVLHRATTGSKGCLAEMVVLADHEMIGI